MTDPFIRPADPSTTPAMTDADVETLWAWPEGGLRIGEFDPPTAYGIAVLLREIDRARAEITRLQALWNREIQMMDEHVTFTDGRDR